MSIDKDIYIKFKHILTGCKTIFDAFYFGDKILRTLDPSTQKQKDMVHSMIQGTTYHPSLDLRAMMNIMNEINCLKYKEDIDDYLKKLTNVDLDFAQVKTLNRIAGKKPMRPINKDINKFYELKLRKDICIPKKCPHCENIYLGTTETKYVICGYSDLNKGYDWVGCNKDWCFECGKMLCKSWDSNDLFLIQNRMHDSECCKEHSVKHNKIYPDDYCQCSNENVNRDIKHDEFSYKNSIFTSFIPL